jgi:GT2 family glycosyltransferase
MPGEILVVDDTPSKHIETLCYEWKERLANEGSNLVYIRNFGRRSISAARNEGIRRSNGEILFFFDTDVILEKNYISAMLHVFQDNRVLGAQGWIVNFYCQRWNLKRLAFATLFHTVVPSKNTCAMFNYPTILDHTVRCASLLGSNMAFRRSVFQEGFRFDQNLEKYSFMEDALLSHQVNTKHPGSLFITPHAKCVHLETKKDRDSDFELIGRYRKYVLSRILGKRGIALSCWQIVGWHLIGAKSRVRTEVH